MKIDNTDFLPCIGGSRHGYLYPCDRYISACTFPDGEQYGTMNIQSGNDGLMVLVPIKDRGADGGVDRAINGLIDLQDKPEMQHMFFQWTAGEDHRAVLREMAKGAMVAEGKRFPRPMPSPYPLVSTHRMTPLPMPES